MYVRNIIAAVNWPSDSRLKMYKGNRILACNRIFPCVRAVEHQITIWKKEHNDGKMSPNLQVVVSLLTSKFYHRLCKCTNKRALAIFAALQVSISRIICYVGAFFLSFFFLLCSYCSSLLFIFPRDFVFACIHVVRNGSFCTFNILVVTGWLWICSCYADLRMIKQVVIMMIVSLILVFCKSSSAVAIISPHLFLPILNYSCYWHYLCYYWTVLYLCYIHILFLFSVSLKRPLFV